MTTPAPTPTEIDDVISLAQKIIVKENTKLHAKNKELKDKLFKSVNTTEPDQKILDLKSLIDKLTAENLQLKDDLSEKILENNQLKTDLSEKINDYDQLKIALSDKTTEYNKLCEKAKNIFNASKSLNKYFQKLPSTTNNEAIKKIMRDCEYEKLLLYKSFDAEYLFSDIYCAIDDGDARIKIMKHIIDNCLDLNVEVDAGYDFTSTRLIHLFCKHGNPELIQYLIDKGVELECPDREGNYPLHLICRHSTASMIKYIIAKGVNKKSNPKIDLIKIINHRVYPDNEETDDEIDEQKELIALIE